MKQSYIYILANKYRTSFYTGVTASLSKRIIEHKKGIASKFTEKYNVINLIKELNPTLKTLDY